MDCIWFKYLDCWVHHYCHTITVPPAAHRHPLLMQTVAQSNHCYIQLTHCPSTMRTGSDEHNKKEIKKEKENVFSLCRCPFNQSSLANKEMKALAITTCTKQCCNLKDFFLAMMNNVMSSHTCCCSYS